MRRAILSLVLALLLALPAGPALSHGFAEPYNLPVPLWLYLSGAAAAVLLSFVLVGFFISERHAHNRYPRINLLRLSLFRAGFASRPALLALRLLAVMLFLLVILSGLFGQQAPTANFAPTFVWIIWWVGLGFLTAFMGNLWALMNPWTILFEWAEGLARRLGREDGLELHDPYPAGLGVWPAVLLYFAFVWTEIVFEGSPTPHNIALLALFYSVVTWTGMVLFGKDAWLRHGEVFSVFFDILAKLAPTEVRVTDPVLCRDCSSSCRVEDADCVNCYECFAWAEPQERELNLRPWAVGLARSERITTDRLAFVVFMLASVSFDGLMVTPLWADLLTLVLPTTLALGQGGYLVLQTLGLLVLPALFLTIYLGFSAVIRAFGHGKAPLGEVTGAFVYSLVPIALAYQVAHYYTLLLIQGQNVFALISDPFGWGWNLFGTAQYRINLSIVAPDVVWYSQVALIVAGHVLAVYLAHVIALRRLRDPRRALRSQYPMLVLMVLYTVSSLWILSQPTVAENQAADTTGGGSAQIEFATADGRPLTDPDRLLPYNRANVGKGLETAP